jgi:hypothetical protein
MPCIDYSDQDVKKIYLSETEGYENYYYFFGENKVHLLNIKSEDILSYQYSGEGFFGNNVEKLLDYIKSDYPLKRNEDLQRYVISSAGSVTTLDVEFLVANLLEQGKVRIWDTINEEYIRSYDVVKSSKIIGREFCVSNDNPILLVFDGIE